LVTKACKTPNGPDSIPGWRKFFKYFFSLQKPLAWFVRKNRPIYK
jgi:hypothetical protein